MGSNVSDRNGKSEDISRIKGPCILQHNGGKKKSSDYGLAYSHLLFLEATSTAKNVLPHSRANLCSHDYDKCTDPITVVSRAPSVKWNSDGFVLTLKRATA